MQNKDSTKKDLLLDNIGLSVVEEEHEEDIESPEKEGKVLDFKTPPKLEIEKEGSIDKEIEVAIIEIKGN